MPGAIILVIIFITIIGFFVSRNRRVSGSPNGNILMRSLPGHVVQPNLFPKTCDLGYFWQASRDLDRSFVGVCCFVDLLGKNNGEKTLIRKKVNENEAAAAGRGKRATYLNWAGALLA